MKQISKSPEGDPADLAAAAVAERLGATAPVLAIVSGSGLGVLATLGRERASLPYAQIPGLGAGSVAGHAGRWILGETEGGVLFYCLLGRRHIYEGIPPAAAGFSMKILARLGVKQVILTNAAGGLGPNLIPGDLMLITDHINLMFRRFDCGTGVSPVMGDEQDLIPHSALRIPHSYDSDMCDRLRGAALEQRIELKEGIYAAMAGPCYETRAEVALLRRLEADAVGMSTVPEALAARRAGLPVAAISLITNSHAQAGPATHEEVLRAAAQSGRRLRDLLHHFLTRGTAFG